MNYCCKNLIEGELAWKNCDVLFCTQNMKFDRLQYCREGLVHSETETRPEALPTQGKSECPDITWVLHAHGWNEAA